MNYLRAVAAVVLFAAVALHNQSAAEQTGPSPNPPSKAVQPDDSALLTFLPPPDHSENSSKAVSLGVYKFFELTDIPTGSAIQVEFERLQPRGPSNLSEYVQQVLGVRAEKLPGSRFTPAPIPSELIAHFHNYGLPYATYLAEWSQKNPNGGTGYGDALLFMFETPGGFWLIVWSTPLYVITHSNALIVQFIDKITVTLLKNEPQVP